MEKSAAGFDQGALKIQLFVDGKRQKQDGNEAPGAKFLQASPMIQLQLAC
jgi:hypothetical protein